MRVAELGSQAGFEIRCPGSAATMSFRVRDVMTADPSTLEPDTLLTHVAEEIIEERYSGLPVVDDGELVGLLEVGDLLPQPSQVPFSRVPVLEFEGEWIDEADLDKFVDGLENLTVEKVMRTDMPIIEADAPLGDAIKQLVEDRVRRLLVVDEEGTLVGVVTRTDLLKAFYRWR